MSDTTQATTPKRTAQISPDRFGVGIFAIFLVAIIMLASMVFSYVSIAEAGQWTHVPYGMHWLAPIFIDGAILTYTVSLAIFESREEDASTIRRTRSILWGFTGLSVVVNFAHAASGWDWDFTVLEAWIGCIIAISAPIAALLSAEEVVRLTFKHRRAIDALLDRENPAEAAVEVPDMPGEAPAPTPKAPEHPAAPEPAAVAPAESESATNEGQDLEEVLALDVQEISDPDQPEQGEQVLDVNRLRETVSQMESF